jgi:hypothetical protein
MTQPPARTISVPAEHLPVIDEADVVVIGGGTAGFIAATAAARTGAKTILVERLGYLGGCTTAPYNTSLTLLFDSDGKQMIRGLAWEFLTRMEQEGQAFILGTRNQLWPPYTRKIAADMVTEAGVELYFYTWASDVIMRGDTIEGVIVQSKAGRGVITATTFVDCSADADIAAFAGAPFEMEAVDDLQEISCDYIACGVDVKRVIAWAQENQDKIEIDKRQFEVEHKEYGAQPMFVFTLKKEDTHVNEKGEYLHWGWMPTVKLCVYREAVRIQGNVNVNPLDPKALAYAEIQGLKGAIGHLQFLKDHFPGFEGAFIVAQSHLGVRESRRILGDYYLTLDDVKGQSRFDDVVALNCRALDYHLKGTLFKIEFLKGNHDVPIRAMLPKGVENLIVAGRCISCDHLSHASLRGAATCMATGQAGGTIAALASRGSGKIRDLDIRQIQRALVEQDAVLSTIEGRRPWEGEAMPVRAFLTSAVAEPVTK